MVRVLPTHTGDTLFPNTVSFTFFSKVSSNCTTAYNYSFFACFVLGPYHHVSYMTPRPTSMLTPSSCPFFYFSIQNSQELFNSGQDFFLVSKDICQRVRVRSRMKMISAHRLLENIPAISRVSFELAALLNAVLFLLTIGAQSVHYKCAIVKNFPTTIYILIGLSSWSTSKRT